MEIYSLRKLCADLWNPIGVPMKNEQGLELLSYPPLPEDEYDSYLKSALDLVISGASKQDVVSYLSKVETEYLGLSQPDGDKTKFVEKLFELAKT